MGEAATLRKDPARKESEPKEPSRGTRPEGAANEVDASRKVREMFTKIAPRYDLLNHLLSLELDRMWRARTARILRPVLERADARILDLCCGTGDLAFALQQKAKGRLWGVDFAHTMLVRAREKAVTSGEWRVATEEKPSETDDGRQLKGETGRGKARAETQSTRRSSEAGRWPVTFVESDALQMPFADGAFDLVATAFGFRNLANYEAGLVEIRRVLKPGGTLAILECGEPGDGWWGDFYRWYFREVLPRVGGLISGSRAAYSYLPSSVERFLRPTELAELMERTGYIKVEFRLWTGGTVALHLGERQS
jgi:demethylmenaquinone methyltransferase / 2-methoxy-6-polyprenyl-1,4-benzoquinol methylase